MKKILNLGSRNVFLPNCINIDLEKMHFTSKLSEYKKMDILHIDTYIESNTIDEIIAIHFFEHLTHLQVTTLLYKLWVLLVPAGKITIVTPDYFSIITYWKKKQQEKKDFSDVDILHIKVFDVDEETTHKTVWYEEIGKWYLERENLFSVLQINKPSHFECKFIAQKI